MRRKKSFIQQLNRLSLEEKIVGTASSAIIVACFFPWYGISSRIMNQWWNGFSNIGYVVGYMVFLAAITSLYAVVAPIFSMPVPKILNKKTTHLFLHGEVAFLLVILSFIYARYTIFDAPGSSVRFGLYTALISSFVGSISGYVMWKKHVTDLKKKGLQEDFIQMPRIRNEYSEVEMEPEVNNMPVAHEREMFMEERDEKEDEEQVVLQHLSSNKDQDLEQDVASSQEESDIAEEKIEDLNKESTVEDLSSAFQGGHQGLKIDEPEVNEVKEEGVEIEKDKVSFDF